MSTGARGTATRTANRERRRERILTCARDLIAKDGYDSFTFSQLAVAAEVTIPTIHNLIGKKSDLFAELVEDMVSRIDHVLAQPDIVDPIMAAESFVDNLIALYKTDENLYRAAFVAGERAKIFEQQADDGIYKKSLKLATQVCESALLHGYLEGKIDSGHLAAHLFGNQRLARHDWISGHIDLEGYRIQVLRGMLITFAADAAPDFRPKLVEKLLSLEAQAISNPNH